MSKNLIIALLGTVVLLFVLDETCIWNFLPDSCSKGVVIDSTNIESLANELGYDICACDNNLRYSSGSPIEANGGTTISESQAREYLRNFKNEYNTPMFGAYISKKALDEIFCADPKANGVYCYTGLLEKPASGAQAEPFIIVEGVTRPDYELDKSTAGLIFRSSSKTMCPIECGSVGETAYTDSAGFTAGSGTH
ncbi:MAG TPA: hypothetical protein PLU53_00900 [Bacteroidia bacterium]|nr:hypothetical protein [Bacteroidia bacterium]